MRRRLIELEHTSENSDDEVEVMAVEEEALEIMDSLQNVRDLRSSKDAEGRLAGTGSVACCCSVLATPWTVERRSTRNPATAPRR
jgi:hypothetical protein